MTYSSIPNRSLENQLAEAVRRNNERGYLYSAIQIVAKAKNVSMSDFLTKRSQSITHHSTLNEDINVLVKLGLLEPTFSEQLGIDFGMSVYWRKFTIHSYEELFINKAELIVKEYSNKTTDNYRTESYPSVKKSPPIISAPPPPPKERDLNLALVLKGNDLAGIQLDNSLSLDQVQGLLANANYFLCTFKKDMNQIKPELNLTEEIDRESEQQVLMIIQFQSALEKIKTFANKLELTQLLRKENTYKVIALETLIKVSGLGKLGFIRS